MYVCVSGRTIHSYGWPKDSFFSLALKGSEQSAFRVVNQLTNFIYSTKSGNYGQDFTHLLIWTDKDEKQWNHPEVGKYCPKFYNGRLWEFFLVFQVSGRNSYLYQLFDGR